MKTAYIIWNDNDNRPLINRENFGNLLVYLTLEQAQARLADEVYFFSDTKDQKRQVSIKEVKIELK